MIASRTTQWNSLRGERFDVLILGGGVSGACLFNQLAAEGYRVLLIDRKDFASATSQSSAMMIWGGLLYLKDFRFRTVWKLCSSRNHLIRTKSGSVRPEKFCYLIRNKGGRGPVLMNTALYSYWALGKCRGARPRRDSHFAEIDFLNKNAFRDSFVYQEAVLDSSDTRFALDWILSHQHPDSVALNYCSITGASLARDQSYWSVGLQDELQPQVETEIFARMIVNCTGPWTDEVNKQFGIVTPFKHVLSKGVFIGFKRFPHHEHPLIMDVGHDGDCMSLIPWGPISLWGPTETCKSELPAALSAQPEDISLLLSELNKCLTQPKSVDDIVSIRHGVRALVVKKDEVLRESSLELSRKFKIHGDSNLPWISVYGGKLTDCVRLAAAVLSKIKKRLGNSKSREHQTSHSRSRPELVNFPGLTIPVSSVDWCVEHEMCWTLEDYLRRRTNVSQWVPRGGLGRSNENRRYLVEVAKRLPTCREQSDAEEAVHKYEMQIGEFDRLLTTCRA